MSYHISMNDYDARILAKTMWGEARGESETGKKAVACVIFNRFLSKAWYSANTVADVCLKKAQFSCWNHSDPNREKLEKLTYIELEPFFELIKEVLEEGDITGGATHYHTLNVNPAWNKEAEPTVVFGNHIFYKGVK